MLSTELQRESSTRMFSPGRSIVDPLFEDGSPSVTTYVSSSAVRTMSLVCSARMCKAKLSLESVSRDTKPPFDTKSAHTRTYGTGVVDLPACTVPSSVPIHGALK